MHKALKIGAHTIEGGSCIHPPEGFDIYVGLDTGMKAGMVYPWEGGIEVCYPVKNFQAPADPVSYGKLVRWVGNQLQAGKRIHGGCMAGHGRTGTLFAAVVAEFGTPAQKKDPITYVRKHYCEKAVECPEQVDFLVKHYGCQPAESRYARAGTVTGRLITPGPSTFKEMPKEIGWSGSYLTPAQHKAKQDAEADRFVDRMLKQMGDPANDY